MRLAALAALGIVLAACNSTPGPSTPSAVITPLANPADTQAGDLRTHLDILLAEHVMVIAKESAAATNHTDDYAAYTTLLAGNSADLTEVWRRAFGNTTAMKLTDAWNMQNGYYVDYAIGAVTHNDDKTKAATTSLSSFVPQFAQLLSDASRLPLDPVVQLESQQVLENKAFIDDYVAQKFPAFYSDLHRSYAQTSRLGDALAVAIADRFPDKFPGDPSLHEVDVRVTANLLLQEHSYLATMATAAGTGARAAEKTAASAALATNADSLKALFALLMGVDAGTRFDSLWSARDVAIVTYGAAGDSASRNYLTGTFVSSFASLSRISRSHVTNQVDAALKVIDDQRAKNATTIAGDDRAAATSMQPIADSLRA